MPCRKYESLAQKNKTNIVSRERKWKKVHRQHALDRYQSSGAVETRNKKKSLSKR